MLNIISWNYRGARARSLPSLVRDMKMKYDIHIFIIVEPRVSGDRAERVISKLGFSNNHRVETEGYSGGIWILWEGNKGRIDIINNSSQCIHTSVTFREGKERFFLSCVYGSPTPTTRQNLWTFLEMINDSVTISKWLCIGDFNAYKGVEDKQGEPILTSKLCLILIIVIPNVISWM